MRRFIRHPAEIPIDVRISAIQPHEEAGCCMTTVSQGGFSCEVAHKVKVGCKVDIDIVFVSPPYHGSGEVIWCHQKGDHFELGVQFTDSQEAYKSRMVQQVCQIEHYKNSVFETQGRILNGDQAAVEWIEKYAEKFS